MTIEPYDRLRFLARSQTNGTQYLVDLGEHNGNGSCQCKHFSCRLGPKLKQSPPPKNPIYCKHIIASRTFFLNSIIQSLLKEEPQPSPSSGISSSAQHSP
jgi:hypothetical protein